ncbi:MAG: Uncharacterized protein G01um10143_580 [Parcubacteria group bacterium Gr01-1014_3]|nr:MAG: Uncharacterized protein G01um10143_580 [Parcubacteria group bacterium Gr01-1014_3]
MLDKLKQHNLYLLIAAAFIALAAVLASTSFLASDDLGAYLALSPQTATITSGDNFSVFVAISSAVDFNAAEAVVKFPKELLEIDSISYEDSIIDLWINPPTFSNTEGILKFSGALTNPEYMRVGNILQISFRAQRPGTARLNFSHASVLGHDGNGTEILEKAFGAIYSIKEPQL